VTDPTLYLFDGFNLLHAGAFADARELRDRLASFVAMKGARGVLVFDGHGADEQHGPLEVRWAEHADALLEKLAAQYRSTERVCLVSSDAAVRGTSGLEVMKLSSAAFVGELDPVRHGETPHAGLADRLDPETRDRLERMRRGDEIEPATPSTWDWSRIVVDHVDVHASDYQESVRFYETVLAPLGIPRLAETAEWTCFTNLNVVDRRPATRNLHVCFCARSKREVDAFHRAGVEAGFRSNGEPGYRDYMPGYYAAYLLDPDDNSVEALFREDQS
jgi:predicted RNA-binding protein with PIN domain